MRVVVTGGGGFVGGAICRRLRQLGHDVTALGRRPHPDLTAEGIRTAIQDLAAADAETGLTAIFAGADCVFHTAAHVKMWGPREAFVRGTITATHTSTVIAPPMNAAPQRKLNTIESIINRPSPA